LTDQVLAGGLLAALLVALVLLTRRDLRQYAMFKAAQTTAERQRFYLRWTVEGFAFMSGASVIALLLLGRIDALWQFPAELEPSAAAIAAFTADDTPPRGLLAGLVGGAVIGLLAAMGATWKKRSEAPFVVGDVEALFPRNRAEVLRALPLAVNAGLSEEIFFRLLLPLLFTEATGLPILACALAAAIFGLVHIYQGWAGVVATTLLGLVMTGVYLSTRSLLLVIALHAALDCVHLVIRPTLRLRRT
jgi:uncharacterized protein